MANTGGGSSVGLIFAVAGAFVLYEGYRLIVNKSGQSPSQQKNPSAFGSGDPNGPTAGTSAGQSSYPSYGLTPGQTSGGGISPPGTAGSSLPGVTQLPGSSADTTIQHAQDTVAAWLKQHNVTGAAAQWFSALIFGESGFDPTSGLAHGAGTIINGQPTAAENSIGIFQLNLLAHPEVSVTQAESPEFALQYWGEHVLQEVNAFLPSGNFGQFWATTQGSVYPTQNQIAQALAQGQQYAQQYGL